MEQTEMSPEVVGEAEETTQQAAEETKTESHREQATPVEVDEKDLKALGVTKFTGLVGGFVRVPVQMQVEFAAKQKPLKAEMFTALRTGNIVPVSLKHDEIKLEHLTEVNLLDFKTE